MKYIEEQRQYLCSGIDVLTKGEKHFSELCSQLGVDVLPKGMVLVYFNDTKDYRLLFQTLSDIDLRVTTNRSLVYYVNGSVVEYRSSKVIDKHIPVLRFSMIRLPTQMELNMYNSVSTV